MTDKEILKEVFSDRVYLIGNKEISTWENSKIKDLIMKFIGSYVDKFGEVSFQELKIDFKAMNPEGRHTEYEINILLVTDKGKFHTKKTGWDAYNTFREGLEAIENQVFKER